VGERSLHTREVAGSKPAAPMSSLTARLGVTAGYGGERAKMDVRPMVTSPDCTEE